MSARPWDATAPLVPGVTVLEASAGTGKTWQIASLVARLVAEVGVPIDRILVVTFTRAATAELSERVRARLTAALRACEGRRSDADDPVLAALAALAASDARVADRLRRALESFDHATISTIHGFCQRMLQQLAFEAGAATSLTLCEDASALLDEVTSDRVSAVRYAADDEWARFLEDDCGLSVAGVRALAELAARRNAQRTAPAPSEHSADRPVPLPQDGDARRALAGAVRAGEAAWFAREVAARARQQGLVTFDDLLHDLARGLDRATAHGAARRDALRAAIRARYQVALIDEFQDTDGVQWRIFREVFGADDDADDDGADQGAAGQGAARHLYLLGDPKQAIYGFRGANVHVYLDAASEAAGRVHTLDTNHRSDPGLVAAMGALWSEPGVFGEAGIEFVPVRARHEDRLFAPAGAPAELGAPLQVRWFDEALVGGAALGKTEAQRALADRVAEDMVDLLGQGFTRKVGAGPARPLTPGDLAVLTRTNHQAQEILGALRAAGVPAVVAGAGSVLDAPERALVEAWLAAVADPGDDSAARRLAVTEAFGWTAHELAALDAEDPGALARWDAWRGALREAAGRFAERGLMAALRGLLEAYDALARLLARPGGERAVTNLLHLAELCHAASERDGLGLAALRAWLARVSGAPDTGVSKDELEQRLDTDAAAVRILTMHKSKGLQFPVVFVPYLWDALRGHNDDGAPFEAPDPADPRARVLVVHPPHDAERAALRAAEDAAQARENMRLAYVALTRAEHRTVLYWGPVENHRRPAFALSPLAPLLHGPFARRAADARGEDLADPIAAAEAYVREAPPATLRAELDERCAQARVAAGRVLVHGSDCSAPRGARYTPARDDADPATPLACHTYGRGPFDEAWRVHSYSSLTQGRHGTSDPLAYGVDHDDGGAPDAMDAMEAAGVREIGAESVEAGDGGEGGEGREAAADREALAEERFGHAAPLAELPAGRHVGTFLHELFEVLDFQDPSVSRAAGSSATGASAAALAATEAAAASARRARIAGVVAERAPGHGMSVRRWGAPLADGVARVLETPLGGALADFRLADLARADRLDELRFDMVLGGGDERARRHERLEDVSVAELLSVPERARPDRLPTSYVKGLEHLRFGAIGGFLTGAIDLVFRVGGRYFLADYKSNRLHPMGTPITPARYGSDAMAAAMAEHHYYLQAYIYAVALDRFLAQRIRDYDPAKHFGGVYYLFVRGMLGADHPPADRDGGRIASLFLCPDRRVIERLDRYLRGAKGEGGA